MDCFNWLLLGYSCCSVLLCAFTLRSLQRCLIRLLIQINPYRIELCPEEHVRHQFHQVPADWLSRKCAHDCSALLSSSSSCRVAVRVVPCAAGGDVRCVLCPASISSSLPISTSLFFPSVFHLSPLLRTRYLRLPVALGSRVVVSCGGGWWLRCGSCVLLVWVVCCC